MVHVRRSLPLLSILALVVNCADTSVDPEPGQDGFVTEERDSSFRGADAGSAGSAAGGGSAAGPQGPTGSREGAPAGRTGEVEEADIYRVDANRLFYLNTYRGFVAYDLGDPAHPVQLGRLPVHGYPIEMFVEGNTVYALLRDALYLTREGSGLAVTRRNVSQLLVIDVTDLAAPRLLRTLDIVGQLREGVSRKIDDTIYVVSYLPRFYSWTGSPSGQSPTEQAWVYAYNVADPSNVVEVDRLKIFEGGGGSSTTGNSSVNTYFSGVAISATANTLHVVENWYTWGSSWAAAEDGGSSGGCSGSQYSSSSRAVVSIIDISDPTGKIRRHARFTTPGSLSDQFKQTYVYDAATRKGYYLGIFARQDWNSTGCRWGPRS